MTNIDPNRAENLAWDDPRHGTTRGFHAGCLNPCCRRAIARYQKGIRYNKVAGRRYSVPAIGAQRRIQALMALGWTGNDIAAAAGLPHRNYVRRILVGQKGKPCTWLERKTHDTIARVFEDLAMRLPEPMPQRARCRTMARNRGWLPPLAWNNIDDPNERPARGSDHKRRDEVDEVVILRGLAGDFDHHFSPAERVELIRRWTRSGRSQRELEQLTGWNSDRYTNTEGAA